MTLDIFRKAFGQLEIAKTDGDTAYFFQLLYLGECVVKTAILALCAGIENDSDRQRYRQLHRLVRANGIGEWAAVANEVLSGPTSQFLASNLDNDKSEFTTKCAFGSWQFESVTLLDECLRKLEPGRAGLHSKLEGRMWFHFFAELRNATRGHGALNPGMCAELCPLLFRSISLFVDSASLFTRDWAYLHRNLSGKYRVTNITAQAESFKPIKSTQPDRWGHFQDGVYIFLDRPILIQLLITDADLSDYFLPNGNFGEKSFEVISYLTNNKQRRESSPFQVPIAQLPPSETQGSITLQASGETFTNLPSMTKGYVRREAHEQSILNALADNERYPVVTLTGRGGIGKTSLALRVLHEIADQGIFGSILWFSSRDVDLLSVGPKQVRPHLLNETDLAKECVALLSPLIAIDKSLKPIDLFSGFLGKSPIREPLCFVFDNFETSTNPVELYQWLDTFIRLPNKILITTRFREFRADYPIEIAGMEEEEAKELIMSTAKTLGIADLISDSVISDLYRESDGHPYILKILLGEISKSRKFNSVERVIAAKDEILEALFERSYARLSPGAQQVFLTLSSWRSTIPVVALEAVLLRPANDRLDVESSVKELEQSSFIEVISDRDEAQSFITVPLAAAVFGKRKLQASPMKTSVEANMTLLLYFGAGQRSDIRHGVGARVERFFKKAAEQVAQGAEVESYLPIMEYVSRRYPPGWCLLSRFYEEWGGIGALTRALEAARRYIESLPGDSSLRRDGWSNLARIAKLQNDALTELQAQVEVASLPKTSFFEISNAINRYNGIAKQQHLQVPFDEKQLLGRRLLNLAEARMQEADATDCSRMAWLCLGLNDVDRAKSFTFKGLQMEPDNDYCLSLLERKEWI